MLFPSGNQHQTETNLGRPWSTVLKETCAFGKSRTSDGVLRFRFSRGDPFCEDAALGRGVVDWAGMATGLRLFDSSAWREDRTFFDEGRNLNHQVFEFCLTKSKLDLPLGGFQTAVLGSTRIFAPMWGRKQTKRVRIAAKSGSCRSNASISSIIRSIWVCKIERSGKNSKNRTV